MAHASYSSISEKHISVKSVSHQQELQCCKVFLLQARLYAGIHMLE